MNLNVRTETEGCQSGLVGQPLSHQFIFVVSCSISVPSPDNSQHYTTKTPQYVAFKLMILAIASCLSRLLSN